MRSFQTIVGSIKIDEIKRCTVYTHVTKMTSYKSFTSYITF